MLRDAVGRIRQWGEERDWRGWDPYDALNSPLARPLRSVPLARRMLVQAVKLSPLNLRPLLRIPQERNAKAIALVASGYARLHAADAEDHEARREAIRWLSWLTDVRSGDADCAAWGYPFDVQTRFFAYPRGAPNTIATSFAAHALLDGVELLGEARFADAALAAARFLERRLLKTSRQPYFRYLTEEDKLVHNANALGCAVLARAARVCEEDRLGALAAEALATTLSAQREDGSWPYAEGGTGDWVDNFHTAYVLESIALCLPFSPAAEEALHRGFDYWEREMFLADGTPKYFCHRTLPLDAHCYVSAVDAWIAAARLRPTALVRAERTARLLVARMLDAEGFVHFQRRRLWTSRVPFVRWTTAPAFRALAGLLAAAPSGEGAEAGGRG